MVTYRIYKITSHQGDLVYYGSTTQTLETRMKGHKRNYNAWKHKGNKNYLSSFELFEKYGLDNCQISLVEIVKCNSIAEARQREVHYISNNNCVNINHGKGTRKALSAEAIQKNLDNLKKANAVRKANKKVKSQPTHTITELFDLLTEIRDLLKA